MNGRQARKALKSIAVANVRPGDTLVVRIREQDDPDGVASVLQTAFRGARIMLLLPGQSVSVIREARAPAAQTAAAPSIATGTHGDESYEARPSVNTPIRDGGGKTGP